MLKSIITLTVSLTICNELHAASCEFLPGSGIMDVNFMLPTDLSIPRDLPIGSTIYETPIINFNISKTQYKCPFDFSTGIITSSGQLGNINTFEFSNSGVAWQWLEGDPLVIISGYPHKPKAEGIHSAEARQRFRLVKVGPIKNGTRVSGYQLATYKASGNTILRLLRASPTIIKNLSCETPDVKVTMKREILSAVATQNGIANVTDFQISLNNCPEGITGVTYSLSPTGTSPALDYNRGIIQLNSTSTARGAGIQITDRTGSPIILDKTYSFNDYALSGGNFKIALAAKYVGNSGTTALEPGSANAEITFIMSYL